MKIDKRIVIQNLPYLLFFWIADKIGYMYRITEGNKLIGLIKGIAEFFKAPLFSFNPTDILIGIAGALAVKGAVYLKGKNSKNTERALNTVRRAGALRKI